MTLIKGSTTERIAHFAASLTADAIPQDVLDRALDLFVDFVGSIIRAAHDADSSQSIISMVEVLGLSGGDTCTVFGLERRFGPAAAALLNGAFGHSLDFDDTHADSSLHPSAPVVPAALAAAEMSGASGMALLTGIVAGIETCCRLGLALDPTAHYARGFHPTATAGTFGACVAAGSVLGLSTEQMTSALGVAASQASGSLQFLSNGGWNKRYQVGEAAMKGLIAATLAANCFKGADRAIEGKHGFLIGYTDGAVESRATDGFGETWETLRVGVKLYPACRYTHAAVDGILELAAALDLSPNDVEAVTIGLHCNGITLVGEPIDEKRRARSIVEGQFSMPFATAVALVRRRFGWDDYDLLGSSEIDAISDKVVVVRDESLENLSHPFGSTLSLLARGRRHDLRIANPSGEPATFPDRDVLSDKFRTLAQTVLNASTEPMLAKLREIPSAGDVRAWLA